MDTKFEQLYIGDMFNTKPARYVKVSSEHAIVVMSGMFPIGEIQEFSPDYDHFFILYTSNNELRREK